MGHCPDHIPQDLLLGVKGDLSRFLFLVGTILLQDHIDTDQQIPADRAYRHGLSAQKIGRLDLQHLCNQHGLAISKSWTWKGYLFRERMYTVLSLLAKTALVADPGWHSPTLSVEVGVLKNAPAGFVTAGAFCMRELQLLHGSRFGF